jgi:hypothetical protein
VDTGVGPMVECKTLPDMLRVSIKGAGSQPVPLDVKVRVLLGPPVRRLPGLRDDKVPWHSRECLGSGRPGRPLDSRSVFVNTGLAILIRVTVFALTSPKVLGHADQG